MRIDVQLRSVTLVVAAILVGGSATGEEATALPSREAVAVVVRDAGGRSLGTIELSALDVADRSRTNRFFGVDGRRLDGERIVVPNGRLTVFRDPRSGATLEILDWDALALRDRPDLHLPRVVRLGNETFYASLSNDPRSWKEKAASTQARARTWLRLKAPKWAPFLEEAWNTALRAFRSPRAEAVLGTAGDLRGEPLFQLGVFFGPNPDGTGIRLEPTKTTGASSPVSVALEVAPRNVPAVALAVEGGRGEALGHFELKRLRGDASGRPGPLALELRTRRLRDRMIVLEMRGGIEVIVGFVRESEVSRRTVARLSGLIGGSGDSWFEPWIVEEPERSTQNPFEIPPSGERERRQAASRIVEALAEAVAANAGSAEEAARILFRWRRLLEQPEVQAAGPAFERLSGLLSEVSPPRFEEDERAWLGGIRLRPEPEKPAER